MDITIGKLSKENKVRMQIDITNDEFVKLFKELKKNELCLKVGMMTPTPLTDIGEEILKHLQLNQNAFQVS